MDYCCDFGCPNINTHTGYCQLTACNKHPQNQVINIAENQMIIFPQTIGDVTFYSKGELVDWVITQQRWNKDPNFGVGNGSY